MNKYKEKLIDNTNKLDNSANLKYDLNKLAGDIIEKTNRKSIIELLNNLSKILKEDRTLKPLVTDVNNSLIEFLGYEKLIEICKPNAIDKDNRTLPELLEALSNLIGLKEVKRTVVDLITYQKIQNIRKQYNLHSSQNTLHLAFTGNPGTGKTTVARIVGRIYKHIGLLSKGHFIEVSRTDLIAGYQGQTALKVKAVIDRAKGGILFIDEAYSITENDHSDSYGKECITELTKALEDYRDDLVVIVAGYTEPMEKFFKANPGLKSRFNTFIEFDDYNAEELTNILIYMCNNNDYNLETNAQEKIYRYFENQVSNKMDNFSNGRLVRNTYDTLIMNHAKRVVNIENPQIEDLTTIKEEDIMYI